MSRIPIDDDNIDMSMPDGSEEGPDANAAQTPEEGTFTGQAGSAAAADGGNVQRLQTERDELFNRLARATADFKNTQKRLQGEFDQRIQYANQSLIKSLLPVIDNFERALGVDPAKVDPKTIVKGMQIVHDQWLAVLKQQNVEEIAPTPGTPFDPTRHEALMQQASDYKEPTVVQLLQKGYSLQGRTLRPAQVAVSKTN